MDGAHGSEDEDSVDRTERPDVTRGRTWSTRHPLEEEGVPGPEEDDAGHLERPELVRRSLGQKLYRIRQSWERGGVRVNLRSGRTCQRD